MGIGWGCILGPATVAALACVPPHLSGVAMGASWTLHNLGAALGLTIATVVFQQTGFGAALWLLCGLSLLTLSLLLAGWWQARAAAAPAAGR